MSFPELTYYHLNLAVTAFSSTRRGGYSEGNYSDFNINQFCGDAENAVLLNRISLCRELNIGQSRLVMPHQIHGTESRVIGRDFLEKNSNEQQQELEGVDALLTQERDICIGISTADCVPVLLFDSTQKIIAAIHAGWRGTQKRIVSTTVKRMQKQFQTNATDIQAVIGPSISLDAFEVGDEVYRNFKDAQFPMDKIARRIDNKWHIDLWEANKLQLMESGVGEENINVAGICTYSHFSEYFSARRMGINSGRIFSGIMIH